MKERGDEHVFLDVTHKDATDTKTFPRIAEKCLSYGIDITQEMIPLHLLPITFVVVLCGLRMDAPALVGFMPTASVPVWLAGNRLASNSLIEAVVFADAAARHSIPPFSGTILLREDIPAWNAEGTSSPEEMVLITQSYREGTADGLYVGDSTFRLRLHRAMGSA